MPPVLAPTTDQRIVHNGTWEQFKLIQQGFDGSPDVRLSFFKETIEILMPGQEHELFAHVIGYLITTFLIEQGIFFKPTGAMTQEKPGVVSAQADESYCIESVKPIPDLAIEVVFTSGGIGKLERYKALGVLEVWFWQDGVLSIYRLQDGEYVSIERSQLPGLSALNLELFNRCVLIAEADAGEAIRTFRQAM